MSDRISIKLTNQNGRTIAKAAPSSCQSMTEAVRFVLERGLMFEMNQSNPKIDLHFLLENQGFIFDLYERYKDAVCTRLELKGELGNKYRLVQVKDCPKYTKGEYVILAEDEILTPHGIMLK